MSNPNEIYPVVALQIESLVPLSTNPFDLYEGQRLEDLVESVQANGVLVPIIVRPAGNGLYEILAGHNRVEASKILGLETVPAIVRDDLSDTEAMFVTIETNLIQRSFSDFSHSERAATITIHYEGIKDNGRRNELVKEVESMLNVDADVDGVPVGHRPKSRERTAREYGLSSTNVARYLRIHKLLPAHKRRLNSGVISIRAAVSLSHLSEEEQELVDEVLTTTGYRLSMSEAEELRVVPRPLTHEVIYQIVEDSSTRAAAPFKLDWSFIERYFKPEQSRDEIENTIAKALDMYFGR